MGEAFGLPVGISFFGRAWSEPVLLKLAYSFEQATRARRTPRFIPTVGLGSRKEFFCRGRSSRRLSHFQRKSHEAIPWRTTIEDTGGKRAVTAVPRGRPFHDTTDAFHARGNRRPGGPPKMRLWGSDEIASLLQMVIQVRLPGLGYSMIPSG